MNSCWSCPACGSAHSPDTVTCPNKLPIVPVYPAPFPIVNDRCPHCGQCGYHVCITYAVTSIGAYAVTHTGGDS